MSDLDVQQLYKDLTRDEDKRNLMYQDSKGIDTIGVGHNLQRPISDAAVQQILEDDVAGALHDLRMHFGWYDIQPEPVQRALANMCFNMGIVRLSGFEHMLLAVQKGDYATAAAEALNSEWAEEVGERAQRVAQLIGSAA